jgi:hypothetical protein
MIRKCSLKHVTVTKDISTIRRRNEVLEAMHGVRLGMGSSVDQC